MVGHNLHSAFRSWFKDTEEDGTPRLPAALSKKYTVLPRVLGQGSFAVVKACVERATGTERALKIIAKRPLKDNNEKMLEEEIAILGKVEEAHVIKMWDLYETKEGVFIVTDLCRGGELFDRLVEKVHYNELDARHIVRQIFEGVAYLHAHDIIHRDLKPENILLRDAGEPSDIVISDFGLSRFIPDEGLLMTACGSPQYVAPEVLLGKGYGPPVDIWSAGVIAYCLLAGYTPFYGEDQPTLFQQIIGMHVEFEKEYWSDISQGAKDFILRCLCPAEKRLTAAQALQHPWLSNLPTISHDTPDEHRGACLKEVAKRHSTSKQKFGRAVTAVETVAYLRKLHTLRQQHSHPDMHPGKLQGLLRVATAIDINTEGQAVVDPHATAEQARHAQMLIDKASSKTLTPETSRDSSMLDEKHESGPRAPSRMDVELCIMGGTAPTRGGGGTSAAAAAADATSHGENPAGNSLGRPVEDAEAGKQGGAEGGAPDSPARSASGLSDTTLKPSGRSKAAKQASAAPTKESTLDALLDQYKSSALPSSARVDPHAEATQPEGMSLAKAWRYVPFLVNQGISIGSAIASHAMYGPLKKSWGLEMTIFTRIIRETARYTEFATISGLQNFFEISNFLPVPKDGLITPVTFRVKKRGLRGLLADADAQEDGKRELTGEWVVGKQTWRRLQAEWRTGKSRDKERVILYIHGGAYFIMSAVTHRPVTISLSKYTECRVFGINYRLAPGCQFPGPLHDVVASWFRLVDDLGIPPGNIVLGADSAGGGLALALMYYLRDNKYDLPAGAILFSPWVDLTMSCDSWDTNAEFDYLPQMTSGNHMDPVRAYLGDNIDKYLTHPYASPLFGDMHGLPPLLIQCGDAEVLRDECTLLAHKASLSGVAVRHELYEDCVHVFQAFLFLDASRKALQSARHFVRTALDKRGRRKAEQRAGSRKDVDAEMRAGMQNEKGERVEPRTGRTSGHGEREGADSDTETMGQSGRGARDSNAADDRSDDDWSEFEGRIKEGAAKAATAPAKLAAKALGVDDEDVTRQQADAAEGSSRASEKRAAASSSSEMRRSQSQPSDAAAFSPTSPLASGSSTAAASAPGSARKHRRNLSNTSGVTPYSLSAARERAEAGMKQQESAAQAHNLARFHDPAQSLKPKMRRTASNAAIDGLLQSFETDPKAVRTRVFTPGE